MAMAEEASGICECGCGEVIPAISTRGTPRRFAKGHHTRVALAKVNWIEEDRGYETPCWIWQGRLTNGYARVHRSGRNVMLHRWHYEGKHGPIPPGLQMDHLCRQPACVNPDHVEPVSPAENNRRREATRLTVEQAAEIFQLGLAELVERKAAGFYRRRRGFVIEQAARYGVAPATIMRIQAGGSWLG